MIGVLYHGVMRCAVVLASLLLSASVWCQDPSKKGTYELSFDGELSGGESGAARFSGNEKLDGQKVFVVHLLTQALEGGVFLVFHGPEGPGPGTYAIAPAEMKGMGGYEKIELEPGEVAVLYYEMERNHMVVLGSTGEGNVEILESGAENVRGLVDVEVKGATGNPNAFLGVRPKRARVTGSFDATAGKVELRKP